MTLSRWDGTRWEVLARLSGPWINDLSVGPDGMLYVSGSFTTIEGVQADGLARWDGESWSAFGQGHTGLSRLRATRSGNVYALGPHPRNSIWEWGSEGWTQIGLLDTDSGIARGNTLYVGPDDTVYVTGEFTSVSGVAAVNIARWNGSSWNAIGTGITGSSHALVADEDGSLYAGTYIGGTGYVVRWDGVEWIGIGEAPHAFMHALALDRNGHLLAGGTFRRLGPPSAQYIARWDGEAWHGVYGSRPLALHGLNGSPGTFVRDNAGGIIVAGGFTAAGTVAADRIARWDGTAWSPLGAAFNGPVFALALDDAGNLYAGGDFTATGSTTVHRVARWDGNAWSPVGDGLTDNMISVSALAVAPNGDLYAGGAVWPTSGTHRILMRWDGSSWNTTPVSGMGVLALAFDTKGALYVAGRIHPNGITKWDGSSWSPLGTGVGDYQWDFINTIAFDDDDRLYVGGSFSSAGGSTALNVALWNGESWSNMGNGVGHHVSALAVDAAGAVYAGSVPTLSSDSGPPPEPAQSLFRWNGSDWETIGSGIYGSVYGLHVEGTALWVGGQFRFAGGTPSSNIARWDGLLPVTNEPGTPVAEDIDLAAYPNPFSGEATIAFTLRQEGPATIEAFDVLGRRVMVVLDEVLEAGSHDRRFDASALPSGVYVLRVSAGGLMKTTRVMVAR